MEQPLKISFHGVDPTPAIESRIRERAAWLERFNHDIVSCEVAVEAPHRHQRKAVSFTVRVDLVVKGGELVVGGDQAHANGDLYVAIRDAFAAARRQLQEHAQRRRGDVKASAQPPHARVARLFGDDGYGFLETPDGREIYFHRNSVLNDRFDRLEVGSAVRFAEEQGVNGPQASTVAPV
jgi:ribosomal subunit interface protein